MPITIKVKASVPKSHDLGLEGGSSGKGDASRITSGEEFRNRFDEIDWSDKPKHHPIPKTLC